MSADSARSSRPAKRAEGPPARPAPTDERTPPPPRGGPRLATLAQARRELARLYRRTSSGELSPKVANALTYQLATLARVLVDERQLDEFAARVAAVETALREAGVAL